MVLDRADLWEIYSHRLSQRSNTNKTFKAVVKEGAISAAVTLDALVNTGEIVEEEKRIVAPSGLLVVPGDISDYLLGVYDERKNKTGSSSHLVRGLSQKDKKIFDLANKMAEAHAAYLTTLEQSQENILRCLLGSAGGCADFIYQILADQLRENRFKEGNQN